MDARRRSVALPAARYPIGGTGHAIGQHGSARDVLTPKRPGRSTPPDDDAADGASDGLAAALVALVGFVLTLLLPELPLRATIAAEAESTNRVGDAFAMPVSGDSLAELRRGLAAIADRDLQRRYLERLVAEARVNLSPAAAWLLVRLEQEPGSNPTALARAHAIDPVRLEAAASDLLDGGLIAARDGAGEHSGDQGPRFGVTPTGCDALAKIIAVRRAHVASAAEEWRAGETTANREIRSLEQQLIPEPHPSAFERRTPDGARDDESRVPTPRARG